MQHTSNTRLARISLRRTRREVGIVQEMGAFKRRRRNERSLI